MFRLKIAMVIGGAVLAYFGVQEFRVSMGTTSEPEVVDLAALESGSTLENNHVLIKDYFADYAGCVYEWEGAGATPSDGSKVTHCIYPIISKEHSFFEGINQLAEKYGNLDDVPDEEWPTIDEFAVLVKTKRYKTMGSIPDGLQNEASVAGLVITEIGGMDSEEKKLILESFPGVDFHRVFVLEQGRKPSSTAKTMAMSLGGGLLTLLGLGSFFLGRE